MTGIMRNLESKALVARQSSPDHARVHLFTLREDEREVAVADRAGPPALWYHRCPTGCDAPTATAASGGNTPLAILTQNSRCTSRWCGGCPGDLIAERTARSAAC